MLITKI